MGIDLGLRSRLKNKNTRHITTPNPYLRLAHKLYTFLARRTDSKFNNVVAKRLMMSRVNRPPLSLKHVAKYMKGKEAKPAVIVANIVDDPRFVEVPKLTIVALKISDTAKERLEKVGGRFMTFDQLAQENPTGKGVVLLRGQKTARKAYKHFGPAPGVPGSKTRPYVRAKGRKFEQGRGRRASRAFKN